MLDHSPIAAPHCSLPLPSSGPWLHQCPRLELCIWGFAAFLGESQYQPLPDTMVQGPGVSNTVGPLKHSINISMLQAVVLESAVSGALEPQFGIYVVLGAR